MGKPAARVGDPVAHPIPMALAPGPGSINVLIGGKPAWRAIPLAAAGALMAQKTTSDVAVKTAESATTAAAGTPGAPAALAAEATTKATATAAMSSSIMAASGGADIHQCATPTAPSPAPHGPGVVINGSPTVLINGLPAARQGDTVLEALGPTNTIVMGLPTVLIGDAASVAPVMLSAPAAMATPSALSAPAAMAAPAVPSASPKMATPETSEGPGLLKEGASFVADMLPVVGTAKSIVELATGKDPVTGEETSRLLAAAGIVAGVVPGGKGALKGIVKVVAKYGDEAVDVVKSVAKHGDEAVEAGVKSADDLAGAAKKIEPGAAEQATKPGRRRKNRIPDEGTPGTIEWNGPKTTAKKYGQDGKVEKEFNRGHGDNAPENERGDHIHDHVPNPHPKGKPDRQTGRKPTTEDYKDFGIDPPE